jgi:hypothetical protein
MSRYLAVRCIVWLGLGSEPRFKPLPLRINASAADHPFASVFFGTLKSMPIKCAARRARGAVCGAGPFYGGRNHALLGDAQVSCCMF